MQTKPVRIGTRGSALALWQANAVRDALVERAGLDPALIEIVTVSTSGDRIRNRPLREVGGKGLFTKEIDEGLADGSFDLAVHSAKDLETYIPDGLVIAGYLPREDVREAFVSRHGSDPDDLPDGATFATASLRRQALIRRIRPDLQITLIRGNVPTRLEKAERGECDATILAVAGLKRLRLLERATAILDLGRFPPACGQGAVAIECRRDDSSSRDLVAAAGDAATAAALACERGFLAALDGSCRSPIAGHAIVEDGTVRFTGLVLTPNGVHYHQETASGPVFDAAAIGQQAGMAVRQAVPAHLLDEIGIG